MPVEIFISYGHEDESLARDLTTGLTAFAFRVWSAGTQLAAADRLARIFEEISKADWVIALLTRASIGSAWVKHEIEGAVLLSLSSNRPSIVPVRVGGIELPPQMMVTIGNRVFVDFDPEHFEEGLNRIKNAIEGRIPESRTSRFKTFVAKNLVALPSVNVAVLNALRRRVPANEPSPSSDDSLEVALVAVEQAAHARTRDMLNDQMGTTVNIKDRERVLKAFDQGLHVPVIKTQDRDRILAWLHRADDTILAFAEDLWVHRTTGRATLDDVADFAERKLAVESFEARWKGQQLVSRAFEVGLLESSTEHPLGYAKIDAESNPSYDFGPMVHVLGPALEAWHDASAP